MTRSVRQHRFMTLRWFFIGTLLTFWLNIIFFNVPAYGTIDLSIIPANQPVSPGNQFNIAIGIAGLGAGAALGGYDVDVGFDPSHLVYVNTVFGDPVLGDQLDLSGMGLTFPLATAGTNSVNLIEVSDDPPSLLIQKQAHAFELAVLTFTALLPGASPITLTINNNLSDANGNPLIAFSHDGGVNLGIISAPVPEPSSLQLLLIAGVFIGAIQFLKKEAA